jgi:hypothetical protein
MQSKPSDERLVIKYIVTSILIARQRLGKHIPAKRTLATIGRPMLGNGSVNKPSQQQRSCVFCVVRAKL